MIQRLEEKIKKLEKEWWLIELWVRSQDKIKLIKVNYCYIRDWQDHFAIEGETFDSAPIIGEYKTKERALEVLDEIQNILETRNDVNQMVYEMPQE